MPIRFHDTWFLIVSVALLLPATGCADRDTGGKSTEKRGDAGKSPSTTSVETVTVTGAKHLENIELPGASVMGFETTKLYAKVGGYVKQIGTVASAGDATDPQEIDIGTIVEEGTVLAILDVPEMDDELLEKQARVEKANSAVGQAAAAVRQAEAAVTQADAGIDEARSLKEEKQARLDLQQSMLNNISGLFDDGAIDRERRDEAEYAVKAAAAVLKSIDAKIKTAKANLVAAQANVARAEADQRSAEADVKVAQAAVGRLKTLAEYLEIDAPFRGVITKRMVDRGALVSPATSNSGAMPLFEITRLDKVRVVASVPSTEAARIAVGQKVVIHNIGGLPGAIVNATVARSGRAFDRQSRKMRIEAHVDNPQQNASTGKMFQLRPGMYATLRVDLKEWSDLPIVPVSAVAVDAMGQQYVMVVESGNICRRQPVELAFNNAKDVGIRDGVKIGEVVVLKDVGNLEDAQNISAK